MADLEEFKGSGEHAKARELPLFQTGANFDNSYAKLPARFHTALDPTPMPAPRLIKLNEALAIELGFAPDQLQSPEGVAALSGNGRLAGAEPVAMAYAGHQFGVFVPQLGDGRAILLGEVIDTDGAHRDLHIKGAGRTPYSRGGDGRAPLGPVLREYIISEAMAALGVATTRALAAIATGEMVVRESPLPGALIVRVARSHVRVGTFEYFAARGDVEALKLLTDYVIARHYPELSESDPPALALLEAVVMRQAKLVANWMLIGFIHGVMNTDNMSIAGETIDFGPCAFMDSYNPSQVYSSIDHGGRYAYGNQPAVAHWNLSRLAAALLPILDTDRDKALEIAQSAIDAFPEHFNPALLSGLRRKIGLMEAREGDEALIRDLQECMAANGADFTLTFRRLSEFSRGDTKPPVGSTIRDLFDEPEAFDAWAVRWRKRLSEEDTAPAERARIMRAANPAFIPRNHLVEEAIKAAVDSGDFGPFEMLLEVLSSPYEDQPGSLRYTLPARPEEAVYKTFCGT